MVFYELSWDFCHIIVTFTLDFVSRSIFRIVFQKVSWIGSDKISENLLKKNQADWLRVKNVASWHVKKILKKVQVFQKSNKCLPYNIFKIQIFSFFKKLFIKFIFWRPFSKNKFLLSQNLPKWTVRKFKFF